MSPTLLIMLAPLGYILLKYSPADENSHDAYDQATQRCSKYETQISRCFVVTLPIDPIIRRFSPFSASARPRSRLSEYSLGMSSMVARIILELSLGYLIPLLRDELRVDVGSRPLMCAGAAVHLLRPLEGVAWTSGIVLRVIAVVESIVCIRSTDGRKAFGIDVVKTHVRTARDGHAVDVEVEAHRADRSDSEEAC